MKGRLQMEQEQKIEISLRDFCLQFKEGKRWYAAVNGIDLDIKEGEIVALIGESGCGKSMTALSMLGLQPPHAVTGGSLMFEGKNLLKLSEKEWSEYRGNRISMIFQEPMTALNPLIKVGKQIFENVRMHQKVSRTEAKKLVFDVMRQVGLPDVEKLYECYPHQLSGGQRQRIMIAMAFVNNPALLVADEPTTALDVTIQAQILELMRKMNRERKSAILLISHDLGVVRQLCSRVYIMYAGKIVESGPVDEILEQPMHPYTQGLKAAIPSAAKRGQELAAIPGTVPALDNRQEKGCGFCNRCQFAKTVCRNENPSEVTYGSRKILCHLTVEEMRERGHMHAGKAD